MFFFSKKSLIALTVGLSVLGAASPAAAASYTVQDHDTFWQLSQRFGIPLQNVLEANEGIDPLNLYPGLVVQLPEVGQKKAKLTATKAKTYAAGAATVTTSSGQALPFEHKFKVTATAYSAAPEENGQWAGLDYMGNRLELGTVAVDPDIIPMGSKLYITGYNSPHLPASGFIARATDQGGAINGNRIDIFVPGDPKNAWSFGIQDVTVYVLK